MLRAWERALRRWVDAGLIEPGLEAKIRAFQQQHSADSAVVQPMVRVALALGGVLIGAGVLLFVSANWDAVSPFSRFSLVLLLVAGFHLAAAGLDARFPALTPVLHALGTISLGGGIFLAGQIFNLDDHWPGGVMLWALGSALSLGLLRDQGHAALTAILVPAWLLSEGAAAGGMGRAGGVGIFLLALAYFTVPPGSTTSLRRPLRMLGGLALLPAGIYMAGNLIEPPRNVLEGATLVIAWTMALAVPLAVVFASGGREWWKGAAAAAWTLLFLALPIAPRQHALVYLWAAGISCGLAWWGLADGRRERVNLAVAGFALAVLFFYFDNVMGKVGRSASLLGLGILFLAGGWALERARRRMIARLREVSA